IKGAPTMSDNRPLTMLCITSEVKGMTFIEESKLLGCRTILLTREKFKDAPEWPRASIDEDFYMPTLENRPHVLNAVSYLARTRTIDRRQRLDALGDEQSPSTLDQYDPGDLFHVDSVVWARQVQFSIAHQYGAPPMSVSHGGGVFNTRTMRRDDPQTRALLELNREVIRALGMVRGINHIEFIKGRADGQLYFLEAAARVGGANIAESIECAA